MSATLRPLSIGELLDRSFSIYRRNFLLFVTLAAIPHFLILSGELGFISMTKGTVLQVVFRSAASVGWGIGLGCVVLSVLYLFVASWSFGAIVSATSAIYLGSSSTISQALGAMKGKVALVAGVTFVTSILVTVGLLLFIVPGIILGLRWALVIPAAVLEEAGVSDSRARSTTLSEGRRGQIFLIFLLYFVVLYALSSVLQVPLMIGMAVHQAAAGAAASFPFWYLSASYGIGFVVGCLVTPIIYIALTLQYFDGRIRKEALDLQMLTESAGGNYAAASAGA